LAEAFPRPLAVINTRLVQRSLSQQAVRTNRVIITATRSGNEQNYTRFGEYLAEAITNPEADLDKDGQVSLLEAFLIASPPGRRVLQLEGALATEHALFDDNGDGQGTPAEWFRACARPGSPTDQSRGGWDLAQQFHLVPTRS